MTQLVRNGPIRQAVRLGSFMLGWQVGSHLEWNVGDRQFLAQGGLSVAEDFTGDDLGMYPCKGKSFVSLKIQVLEKYRENNAYKYNGVGWLFQSSVDALQRDNEKLRNNETVKITV